MKLLGWLLLFLALMVSLGVVVAKPFSADVAHFSLTLRRLILLDLPDGQRFDPSGLALDAAQSRLLTVNDKLSSLDIFAIPLASIRPLSDQRIRGQRVYHAKLLHLLRGQRKIDLPIDPYWRVRLYLDLEGITRCQGHLLVISEQLRMVFRIDPKTRHVTQHPIAMHDYARKTALHGRPMARFSIDYNSGYEGIVCDEAASRIYLIQERHPRMILTAHLPKTWKEGTPLVVFDHFDLPSFSLPRLHGRVEMEPDFSGADVWSNHLYVLYRNLRMIMKVEPKTHRLVAVASYRTFEDGLYDDRQPYGLAEGIAVSDDRIWIVLDNNGLPLRNAPSDRRPILFEIDRPAGF